MAGRVGTGGHLRAVLFCGPTGGMVAGWDNVSEGARRHSAAGGVAYRTRPSTLTSTETAASCRAHGLPFGKRGDVSMQFAASSGESDGAFVVLSGSHPRRTGWMQHLHPAASLSWSLFLPTLFLFTAVPPRAVNEESAGRYSGSNIRLCRCFTSSLPRARGPVFRCATSAAAAFASA